MKILVLSLPTLTMIAVSTLKNCVSKVDTRNGQCFFNPRKKKAEKNLETRGFFLRPIIHLPLKTKNGQYMFYFDSPIICKHLYRGFFLLEPWRKY